MRPSGVQAVAHTCPHIDRVLRLVRRHVADPGDRAEAIGELEQLRAMNTQLRANAAAWELAYREGSDG